MNKNTKYKLSDKENQNLNNQYTYCFYLITFNIKTKIKYNFFRILQALFTLEKRKIIVKK